MKGGWPPTARKARTGELTPPGKSSIARRSSSSEWTKGLVSACMASVYGAGVKRGVGGGGQLLRVDVVLGDVGVQLIAVGGAVSHIVLRDALVRMVQKDPALEHAVLVDSEQ